MITLILTTVLSLAPVTIDFAQDVAEKLQGEGAQTIERLTGNGQVYTDAVCTVRNRLESGLFTTSDVLAPYYAPSVPTNPEHVQRAYDILTSNAIDCGELWYMYSHQDIINLGIPRTDIVRRYTAPRASWFGLNYVNR